jgi:hypothetical protein
MWPVQTLTLLLCLTEEEQLFAQVQPAEAFPQAVEQRLEEGTAEASEEAAAPWPC